MQNADVIVIGAGPAGCASAVFLAQKGRRVTLLDRATFPRDKVCGEFISPAADGLLEKLGVLAQIEAQTPLRLKGVAISAYGEAEVLCPYPPDPGSKAHPTSLSIGRLQFDQMLVEATQNAGVEVLQGHSVSDFIVEDDQVIGVKARAEGTEALELRAPVVIDAGGRNAVSLRRFDLKQSVGRNRKIALAAHWQGVTLPLDYCYMHISRPGYTGLSPVQGGGCNVVLVVDPAVVKGRDLNEVYQEVILSNPLRKRLLNRARPIESVRTVDSLAFDVKPVPVGGLVLVGDAMGFIDPFTGEGIYLALRSAELAAETVDAALKEGANSREHLAIYSNRRKAEFRNKFVLSRVLQFLIYNKVLCRKTVRTLERRPDLADSLVGVIGDYVPAEQVVSLPFLGKLLLALMGGQAHGPLNKKREADVG